jgi:hypothetical protein
MVWRIAAKELESAERVVLAGLSFAESDFLLEWLIRETIGRDPRPEIEIVNLKKNVAHIDQRLGDIAGVDQTRFGGTFRAFTLGLRH